MDSVSNTRLIAAAATAALLLLAGCPGDATKKQGEPCGAPTECSSGNCVDGYCCDSPCTGTCVACDVASTVGTCSFVPADTDPADDCGFYTCDGAGACITTCTVDTCSGHCDVGAQCVSGSCIAGLANGTTCVTGCECASGHCSDGVCCDLACDGACMACDLVASVGTCAPYVEGSDPQDECGNYTCSGLLESGCNTACTSGDWCDAVHCDSASFCSEGNCTPKLANGATCSRGMNILNCLCQSGYCRFYPGWGVWCQ
jgi:hypothetical protein